MPPFRETPSPISPFQIQKPPELKPDDSKIGGMDQQTRNTIMFAVIFSVLAVGVLLFIFLKPGSETKKATTEAAQTDSTAITSPIGSLTTTTQTGLPAPKQKSFWASLFDLSFSTNPSTTGGSSDMFNTSPTTGGSSGMFNTSPPLAATTSPKGTSAGSKTGGSAPTATTPKEVPTTQLVGIYSELPAAEAQLDLQFYKIDLPSSPLRGKIFISSVQRSTDSKREYVTLSTNKDLPSRTKVTGMIIKSVVTGQTVQVGKGVGLPTPNDVNTPVDIFIEPGQKVLVNTSSSPLGYSFRINKCTGYYEQYQDFSPSLQLSCPMLQSYPRPAPPNQLQDPCLDYIQNFPRCTITNTIPKTYADKLNDEQKNRCINFIQNNTGYQNCVRLHSSDNDFLNPEWRTYLNWSVSLWKSRREVIWLLDQEGRFISQYSY